MIRYSRRLVRVAFGFLPFLVAALRDRRRFLVVGGPRAVSDERRRERARRFRDTMLALGPTYIKIGQVLSTRPDLVPPVFAEELATLQDTVPPSPVGEVESIVAADVGMETYDEFETDPIAGGSLAQVHAARYRGRRVAVKVRRPGVADLVETDLRIVRLLLPVAVAVAPKRHRFSLRNLAGDFERIIEQELDFAREGRMMAEIRENFSDDPGVRIPERYPEASSGRVLTMEFVESVKITDVDGLRAAGFDPPAVARDVANAYFEMGLVDGVFHGDPHPGNLGVDAGGRVVFYDFGMSGRFTPEMQTAVVDLYLAGVERDTDRIVDVLIDLGALDRDVDRTAMDHVLRLAIRDLEGSGPPDWRALVAEMSAVLREFPFRVPPDIMLLLRVGTVGEGVLRGLDPEFDFLAAAREFLVAHGYRERGVRQWTEGMGTDAAGALRAAVRLPAKAERLVDTIQRGDLEIEGLALNRPLTTIGRALAFALITAAWVVGSAILTDVSPLFGALGWVIAAVMTLAFLLAVHRAMASE